MRILQIAPRYPPDHVGGVELQVEALSRELVRRDHEVGVLLRTADWSLPEFGIQKSRRDGVTLFRLCHRFGRTHTFADLVHNPSVDHAASRVLETFQPDIVHAHHFTTLSATILDEVARQGLRSVVSLHDYWLGCPRGQMLRQDGTLCRAFVPSRCHPCLAAMWPAWFPEGTGEGDVRAYQDRLRGLLAAADAILTPSRFHRDRYVEQGWIDAARAAVIPYGIARGEPPRRHAGPHGAAREGPFRFGFLGTILPSKGVHVLLEAFRRFGPGDDVALEIHGSAPAYHQDDTYGDRCRALAAGDPRVSFGGRFGPSDTAPILGRLDALVVPSLWEESYCIVAREGFRAGIPVILGDFGAAREEFGDGRGALLVRRGDPEDLYVAMRRLREEPALRDRLVRDPKRLLSPEENADAHEQHYRELIAGRGRIHVRA